MLLTQILEKLRYSLLKSPLVPFLVSKYIAPYGLFHGLPRFQPLFCFFLDILFVVSTSQLWSALSHGLSTMIKA